MLDKFVMPGSGQNTEGVFSCVCASSADDATIRPRANVAKPLYCKTSLICLKLMDLLESRLKYIIFLFHRMLVFAHLLYGHLLRYKTCKVKAGGVHVAIHLPTNFVTDQPSCIKRSKISCLAASYTFSM